MAQNTVYAVPLEEWNKLVDEKMKLKKYIATLENLIMTVMANECCPGCSKFIKETMEKNNDQD